MPNRAIALATLVCIPAAAALIVNAPIAPADTSLVAACALPENVVRTAATAGDVRMACSPYIPPDSQTSQGSTSATNQR
jgi:hypothetical protein